MSDYAAMIRHTEARLNALKAAITETYRTRDTSPTHREKWKRACDNYHSFETPIDDLLEACETQGIAHFADLRAFAFAYVEVDPYFFRSGYIMEYLLRQIKRLEFTEPEKTILRTTILKRIDQGARREFRYLCRTLPKIKTKKFEATLHDRTAAKSKAIRDRAEIAISYL